MNKKLQSALAILLISSTSFFTFSSPALAAEQHSTKIQSEKTISKLSESEKNTLTKWLHDNGVQPKTIHKLFLKLENNQMWDSATQGIDPIKTVTINVNKTKYIYPDGSIQIYEVTNPTKVVKVNEENKMRIAATVDGGSRIEVGSGYKNIFGALVHHSNGILSMEFKADYTISQGNDYIKRVYDERAKGVLVGVSQISLEVTQQYEDRLDHRPAEARLFCIASPLGGAFGSSTYILKLQVQGSAAKAVYV